MDLGRCEVRAGRRAGHYAVQQYPSVSVSLALARSWITDDNADWRFDPQRQTAGLTVRAFVIAGAPIRRTGGILCRIATSSNRPVHGSPTRAAWVSSHSDSLSVSTTWHEHNAEGLALAGSGRWVEATRAFEQALEAIGPVNADGTVTAVAHDDIRARLLLNIGQCHFHLGVFEESRRLVERSCAIRVSLYGEDSLVVARTRGDLAVILAASGHTDEAISLLDRAVSAVERKRGDESAYLLPLLANAARLLARSAPDRARPYVARLKALVFAQQQAQNAVLFPPSAVPSHSFAVRTGASGSDDHLLRTAIAQTIDLLRTTPAANTAVPGDAGDRTSMTSEAMSKVDDTIFDLVEPPPPTLSAIPRSAPNPGATSANPFGFEVQYGIPSQLHEQFENPTTPLPEESTAVQSPPSESKSEDAAEPVQTTQTDRSGIRAVGGVRRGSTQVVAMNRVWIIAAGVAAFGGGVGAFFLYNYIRQLVR